MRVLELAACVALAACQEPQPPQVAFLVGNLHQRDVKFFEARAHELGMRVETLAADREGQRAEVEHALAAGAKVLVVQPADAGAAAYVELAHEKGAKIVAYDRAIVAPDLDYYVSHDSYRVGVLQAQAALHATHERGRYAILTGDDATASEITRGYKDTLAPYVARGEIAIVSEGHESRELAGVDAVLATSSRLARAAVAAVDGAPVFIAGADAEAANVNLVCQGKQAIEVWKDVEPLARTAAETAKKLLDGEIPAAGSSIALAGKSVPVAAVRVEVVTADNVKPLLVDTGFLTADELPACKNRLAAVR